MSRTLIWIVAAAALAGAVMPIAAQETATATPDPAIMTRWARSCALCHLDGNAGAPRAGREDEWQPRLAQGMDVLLEHTISGFNKMPPLGYCMACEEADFRAMIEFMTGESMTGQDR